MSRSLTCIHLLNNFSGSPNVLATVLNGLNKKQYKVTLITSFNNNGFLSNVEKVSRKNINYTFKENKFLRLFQFIKFQVLAAFYINKTAKNEIIYINTILPFFPALIAKLNGQKVMYHVHEAYPKKSVFNKFLFLIVQLTATKIICVSKYVKDSLGLKSQKKAFVVYNSLNIDFLHKKMPKNSEKIDKVVLMISSARGYKGIFEFCKLAMVLPQYKFNLVCDASEKEINDLFYKYKNINNLKIIGTQTNLHPFYAEADLILNLSNPKQIIETFGLTVLEGLSYGIPAIVPPVGGITELVDETINGLKVDVNNKELLIKSIISILNNDIVYKLICMSVISHIP